MLKPIDILVALKIATSDKEWTQMGIASKLLISSSQVNSAIKQLIASGLFNPGEPQARPVFYALEEFLLNGLKYSFPAITGGLTVGMPTAYAAEPMCQKIMPGNDPIPVWPYNEGIKRGIAVEPLHKNVPAALTTFPDPDLKELLVLIDALRIGRARERNIAKEKIKEKLNDLMNKKHHITPNDTFKQ